MLIYFFCLLDFDFIYFLESYLYFLILNGVMGEVWQLVSVK